MPTRDEELYERFLYEQYLASKQQNEDIPTGSDLVGAPMPAESVEKDDGYSIKDTFIGMLETAAALTTGAVGGTAGHVYGTVDGLVGGLMNGMEFGNGEMAENMAGRANEVSGALTYAPRTEAGREFTEAVGGAMAPLEALEPIMPALGILPDTRRVDTSRVPDQRTIDQTEAALEVNRGAGNPEMMGNPEQVMNGALYPGITRDRSAEALTVQGSPFMAPEHVQAFKNADPATKAKLQKMQEEAKLSNNGVNAQHSPYNVIADEFQTRAETLGQVGEQYIADMADAMAASQKMDGNNVRTLTGELQNSMVGLLREYGVKFDPESGTIDFRNSKIFKGQEGLRKAVERFMHGTTTQSGIRDSRSNYATFEDLHNLKLALQDAGYGTARSKGPNAAATAAIQRMSGLVNDTARSISPEYGAANDGLSMVIRSMQELADATKTDVSLNETSFTREQWRKVANNTRKLTSNYDSGVNLDETLKRMDEVLIGEANKFDADGNYIGHVTDGQMGELNLIRDENGNFVQGTNPRELALFAHYMNAFYGDGKVTSFRGLTQQANNHLDTMAANALWGNNAAVTGQALGMIDKLKSNQRKIDDRTKATRKDQDLNATARANIEEALDDVLWRGVPFL